MAFNLSHWVYILKTLLRSKQSRYELSNQIKANCLDIPRKIAGTYYVDQNKIWNNIILKDKSIMSRLNELNISNVYEVMAYYEEVQYKNMRSTYPRKRHKRG